LKERYGESICLWNYRADWYERYLSDVNLSEVRMKKLEKVYLPELLEVKIADAEEKKSGVSGGDAGYVGTREKMSGSQGV